jgi:hypothetical protein
MGEAGYLVALIGELLCGANLKISGRCLVIDEKKDFNVFSV